jgi:hypothetical protein
MRLAAPCAEARLGRRSTSTLWNDFAGSAFVGMGLSGESMGLSGESPVSTFVCPECRAEYAVVRRDAPADAEPSCEQCDHPFPDEATGGGWLHYERAKTQ